MKVKSILAVSLLAAGAAFADTTEVDTEYVLGVMPVAVTNETIIAIPWIESGGASSGIAVTNLIKTATLAVGDALYWYDTSTGKYHSWIVASGDGSTKYWQDAKVVSESDDVGESSVIAATQAVLNRGQALFLKRSSDCVTTNIYVVGQYTNAVANTTKTRVAGMSENVPSYTLLAPPSTVADESGDVDLNTFDWGTPNVQDTIIVGVKYVTVGDSKVGVYDRYVWGTDSESKSGWGKRSGITFTRGAKIPLGKGFWYKSYRSEAFDVIWD